jgi:hypothetical protein
MQLGWSTAVKEFDQTVCAYQPSTLSCAVVGTLNVAAIAPPVFSISLTVADSSLVNTVPVVAQSALIRLSFNSPDAGGARAGGNYALIPPANSLLSVGGSPLSAGCNINPAQYDATLAGGALTTGYEVGMYKASNNPTVASGTKGGPISIQVAGTTDSDVFYFEHFQCR